VKNPKFKLSCLYQLSYDKTSLQKWWVWIQSKKCSRLSLLREGVIYCGSNTIQLHAMDTRFIPTTKNDRTSSMYTQTRLYFSSINLTLVIPSLIIWKNVLLNQILFGRGLVQYNDTCSPWKIKLQMWQFYEPQTSMCHP